MVRNLTPKEALRNLCRINKLSTAGTKVELVQRLKGGAKKKKATGQQTTKPNGTPKSKKKTASRVTISSTVGSVANAPRDVQRLLASVFGSNRDASTHAMYKKTPSGAKRLSAAHYFYDVCDGILDRCAPQLITQPNGAKMWKKIRIVKGASGWHPRWVKAA